jgi:hypothetical protein
MEKIENTLKLLKNFPDDMWSFDTCIKINIDDIIKVENIIWYNFPEDYKYFLLNYNWISIPYEYLYGITNRKYDDILENYLSEHDINNPNTLPNFLVPFCPNWWWDYYCLNKNDNKVYFWQHDCDDPNFNPDYDCESFSDWLEENIKNSLEV